MANELKRALLVYTVTAISDTPDSAFNSTRTYTSSQIVSIEPAKLDLDKLWVILGLTGDNILNKYITSIQMLT